MGLFNKQNNYAPTQRQALEMKYMSARTNFLLVAIFTAINLCLLVANSNTYFLFSAYVPYMLVDLGMFLCGKYPAELYEGELAGMEFLDDSFFVITLVIAVAILAFYVLTWFMSGKHRVGWMIAALVLFAADTIIMFAMCGIALEMILDILFHAWVLYYLAMGIYAHYKQKTLPPDEEELAPAAAEEGAENAEPADSAESGSDAESFTYFNEFPEDNSADNDSSENKNDGE